MATNSQIIHQQGPVLTAVLHSCPGSLPCCVQTYREPEELVELGEQHVAILHLAPRVADGVDGHQQETCQGPQRRQLLLPLGAHVPELVKKAALQRLCIQHCQHRDKTVTAVSHVPTLAHLLACLSFKSLPLQLHTHIQHPAFTGSARIKMRSREKRGEKVTTDNSVT